jgi:Gpi18-like mannosyltransferase
VASVAAYFLARSVAGQHSIARLIAPFCILAGPTVILNGAVWGQCDIVYTSFLILTVAAMIAGRGALAVLLFGVALACKLQAIFLCPFLLAMLLQKRIRWHHILLLPVGWIISLIPPLLNGASIPTYLSLPAAQGQEFSLLSIEIGNIWVLAKLIHLSDSVGIWIGVVATLVAGMVIGLFGARPAFQSPRNTLLLACASLVTMPYIMPRMHDRYFLSGEVMLCILACADRAYALPAGLLLSGSLLSYGCYFQPAYRHWVMGPAFLVTTLALVVIWQRTRAVWQERAVPSESADLELLKTAPATGGARVSIH